MSLTADALAKLPVNPDTQVATPGKATLLYVDIGTTGTESWKLVGGQRNSPLNETADSIDASHKASGGWKVTIAGLKGWTSEYDGLVILDDEGLQAIHYCFRESKQVHVKLAYEDCRYRTGWAFVTAYNEDNSHTGVQTLKVTLTGVGAISDIQPAPTNP